MNEGMASSRRWRRWWSSNRGCLQRAGGDRGTTGDRWLGEGVTVGTFLLRQPYLPSDSQAILARRRCAADAFRTLVAFLCPLRRRYEGEKERRRGVSDDAHMGMIGVRRGVLGGAEREHAKDEEGEEDRVVEAVRYRERRARVVCARHGHWPKPSTNVPLFLYRAFTCLVTLIIPEKSILQHLLSPFAPVVLLFHPLCDYARGGSLSCKELGLQVSSRRTWMEIDVNVPRKQPPSVLPFTPSHLPHPFALFLSTEHHTDDHRCCLKEHPPRASRGS
ncbi:hypothetical protein ALC57_13487 [Trachymyrmex cornetzi]|uniref:Uncharacterized protein n=1 Tax=Trachymyrmex cornetzi TaxID=471704 RepID=A0A195DN39_9HYME|nr:hypothetical protein ALC57_13487 [Trachymyrmex cornetzi]